MLKRVHVRPFLRVARGRVSVAYLRDEHGRAAEFCDRLCRLVRRLEAASLATVTEALRRQERRVRDTARLAGIAKTLLDQCDFEAPAGAGRAPAVRDAVFRARGRRWPPVPSDHALPYAEAAAELSMQAGEAEQLLYADLPAARRLVRAPAIDGRALVAQYNLELARGVLLDAERVVLTARGGWRGIFRAVKIARLMHKVARSGRSYRVELTGPAASFVTNTTRYGARFARIVPALARAPGWRLEADIRAGTETARFTVRGRARSRKDASPLGAMPERAQYDSQWERRLARDLRALTRTEYPEWTLTRETTPVVTGDSVFLPDFTLCHADGREALVEVVGFWTPEYLTEKLRKVEESRLVNLVLVVHRSLAVGSDGSIGEHASRVVWFSGVPKAGEVIGAAKAVAATPPRRAFVAGQE